MKKRIRIAFAGNPNSGKSTTFNAITGARQHIANYPGITVEKKTGWTNYNGYEFEVIDLPGIYSLTAYSLEEIIAREFILNEKPDVVVDIVDASNLDRNLYLAIQLREMGVPLIIALNMMDMAETRGIQIRADLLSNLLQVPCIPCIAKSNSGISDILDKAIEIYESKIGWKSQLLSYGRDIDECIKELEIILSNEPNLSSHYEPKWLALKCIEGDEKIIEVIKKNSANKEKIEDIVNRLKTHIQRTLEEEPESIIADHRYGYITGITKKGIIRDIQERLNLSDMLDRVLTNRVIGPAIMICILYITYVLIFWISEFPIEYLEKGFELLKTGVNSLLPEGILRSLLVSGIIDGVGGVIGFVPLIMFMFFAIAILEDSGYTARMAYMMDRVLRWFGLHGNSILPFIVSGGISGGCVVPGVLATRTLKDTKERLATMLVLPFMNCGAKLPVYGVLISAFFQKEKAKMMFLFTIMSWVIALFSAKLIRSTILKGEQTPFVMELPPYRAPTLRGLIIHAWERTWQYIKKAGTIILAISIIMWAGMRFPQLPDNRSMEYINKKESIINDFLNNPSVRNIIKTGEDFDKFTLLYLNEENQKLSFQDSQKYLKFYPYIEALHKYRESGGNESTTSNLPPQIRDFSKRYTETINKIKKIEGEMHQAQIMYTFAGRIGKALEKITQSIGFDWKINLSLIGGFAAKEVIVSTLGTAYSLGGNENEGSLSRRIANDPSWNRVSAFTLILFSMLYVPCLATLVAIKKESSFKWAMFSVVFNLLTAYIIAFATYRIGLLLVS